MIIHHRDNISQYTMQFQKKLQYMDEFSFVPIKIVSETNTQSHIFQTPLLFTPYGIQTKENGKQTIDLSFMNKVNDPSLSQFVKNLQQIYSIVYKKYSSKYNVNQFLKQTIFDDCLRLKVNSNLPIFDQHKEKMQHISSFSYGWFLVNLHGLWFSETDVWFQWYLVQAKIIEPIRIHEYLFLEDTTDPLMHSETTTTQTKVLTKYDKMLKMGVPKEAVDRQRRIDRGNHMNSGKIPVAPPPPLPGNTTSVKRSDPPRKITSGDLQSVVLRKPSERKIKREPVVVESDSQMGFFEPPSLLDIQNTLKRLKSVKNKI